jgi:hypothetical protein
MADKETVFDNTPSIKKKHGPRSKFTLVLAERIYHCARYGMTNTEICWTLKFSDEVLDKWLRSSEVFRNKLDDARNHADGVIERSLYHRAKGMKVIERVVKENKETGSTDKDGKALPDRERTERTVVERELPPDAFAAIKWLVNRRPEKWKEKPTFVMNDNRQQLMLNFNAQEVANLLLNEYPNRAKAISDAVSKVIGIGMEGDATDGRPLSSASERSAV